MLKSLFRDSILYTLSTVLTRGLNLLLLPLYTRYLSPDEFGLVDYFVALGAVISVILTLEIGQGLARYIPENMDNIVQKKSYASTNLWFISIVYSLIFLLVFIYSDFLALALFKNIKFAHLLIAMTLSISISAIISVLNSQLRWELRANASAALSVFLAISTVGFALLFVVIMGLGVQGVIYSQIFGGVLTLIPAVYITRSSFGFDFDMQAFRRMLSFSIPLVPSSLAVISLNYFDRIVLKELMTLSDLGVYVFAQKISLIVSLAMIGFRSALTPLIYANYKKTSTPKEIAIIFQYFCLTSLCLIVFISFYAPEIVALMGATEYAAASEFVPYLAFSVLLSSMYIFAPGLDIAKKTSIISIISISTGLINIILINVLVSNFGVKGAAISSIVSFSIFFAVYMQQSQRLYPVPHRWTLIVSSLMVVILVLALVKCFVDVSGLSFVVKLIGVISIAGVIILINKRQVSKDLSRLFGRGVS
jgi:O-antigen/teichoic acid export membrane protein